MFRSTCNVGDDSRANNRFAALEAVLGPHEEPPLGSHLVTQRQLYNHHGIYVGDGRVVHYAGFARRLRRGPVEEVSLDRFAHGRDVRVRRAARRFDPAQVVARARSRLGENRYRVLTNNCAHFCAWALRDETGSAAVDRLVSMWRARYERIDQNYRQICEVLRLLWHRSGLALSVSRNRQCLTLREPT